MAITFDMRGRDEPAALRGAQGLIDRAHAFRLARRHSLLVKALKVALPVCAAGTAVAYVLMLNTAWSIGPGRLNPGQIEITADDLAMKNPSYFGVTKDGGRYQVRAKRAVLEFSRNQSPIKLIDIDGELTQANNVTTKVKARHGLLDNAKSHLELFDGIEIDATNGMTARLSQASISMKEHRVVSTQPVTATTPTGAVTSAGMTLQTDTREASFQGNVAVRLTQNGGQTVGGFGSDSRQPIEVYAERLDVSDAAKTARFTGNVTALQAGSSLRSPELVVTYEGRGAASQFASATKSGEEGSRLSRLIARRGATVTTGEDRRIASEQIEFDAKSDTALFTGGVAVTQGRNMLNGRRLFVDRKAGKSRLDAPAENGQPQGRISATFYQTDVKPAPAKPKSTVAEAAASVHEELFGSFKLDPNAPIDIEADTLDVNDPARQAVFRTNVRVQQGEFVVRTVELTAIYSGQAGLMSAGPADVGAPAQLQRIEARQKVLITSKEGQTATGDWAIFDIRANTVLMGGRVVVTRGRDVAEGPRLKIDLTTGMYRFEAENESAGNAVVRRIDPPKAGAADSDPAKRACPPGKQCLLAYPKDAQDRAKEVGKKVLPNLPTKIGDGWQSGTTSEPARRGN